MEACLVTCLASSTLLGVEANASRRRAVPYDTRLQQLSADFPKLAAFARVADELTELMLEVDSPEKADTLSPRIALITNKLKDIGEQVAQERSSILAKKAEQKGNAAHDHTLQEYDSIIRTQLGLFGIELPHSIHSQGFMTPSLSQALQIRSSVPAVQIPPMSLPMKAYWKEKRILENRRNRILYSLRTIGDLPRVEREISENEAALGTLECTARLLGLPGNKQDQTADRFMRQRSPLRMANVLLAILRNRSGLLAPDGSFRPEVMKLLHIFA